MFGNSEPDRDSEKVVEGSATTCASIPTSGPNECINPKLDPDRHPWRIAPHTPRSEIDVGTTQDSTRTGDPPSEVGTDSNRSKVLNENDTMTNKDRAASSSDTEAASLVDTTPTTVGGKSEISTTDVKSDNLLDTTTTSPSNSSTAWQHVPITYTVTSTPAQSKSS